MPTDLFLVRHGQVHADWRGRIYGCLDVPLSDEGRAQARRAAAHLAHTHLDGVISSGLSRTRYGAEHIALGRGVEHRVEPDLREIDRGDWAGRSFEDLEAAEPGAFDAWRAAAWTDRPPGGESMSDLSTRVLEVLDQLAEEHPSGALAVVVHSHVVRCALARVLDPTRAMSEHLPTGSVLHFAWYRDRSAELLSVETFGSTEAW